MSTPNQSNDTQSNAFSLNYHHHPHILILHLDTHAVITQPQDTSTSFWWIASNIFLGPCIEHSLDLLFTTQLIILSTYNLHSFNQFRQHIEHIKIQTIYYAYDHIITSKQIQLILTINSGNKEHTLTVFKLQLIIKPDF